MDPRNGSRGRGKDGRGVGGGLAESVELRDGFGALELVQPIGDLLVQF